ncbi:hypothetical protein [Streptomyces griseorubiginosus]|uniref:hypothetical protein n=1 Tax=Streptomyces griseorubiginosus TaxID=67304 RepID=UPI001AD6255D|nr:hypothetical protein [Streptomyces griseorubiginosus]MBO4257080.1 hypothetical protein [Streptomyces griseorubiginosus]
MSTEAFRTGSAAVSAPGALLLCRARPESVVPAAQLLQEHMLLTRAGDDWSVLVPEGTPWLNVGEPVDRVLTGWATALAVGGPWPVLALWWDADRAGYILASGFRRPVGYVWLANGTPAGEDEAMHTFAARLGLDPVLDVQALDHLTKPDRVADARARLRALLAVLTRAGVSLPEGMAPGEPADRLREAARARSDTRPVHGPGSHEAPAARPELTEARPAATNEPPDTRPEVTEGGRPAPRLPWPGLPGLPGLPGPRALALAQVAVGIPLTAWGLRRRDGGWIAAGALLLAHGVLGLTYTTVWPWD